MLVVQLALRDVISDAVLDENGNAEEQGTCPNTPKSMEGRERLQRVLPDVSANTIVHWMLEHKFLLDVFLLVSRL